MVMIANKKSKSQMASDLTLFLGSNAAVFTDWLHSTLAWLQASNEIGKVPMEALQSAVVEAISDSNCSAPKDSKECGRLKSMAPKNGGDKPLASTRGMRPTKSPSNKAITRDEDVLDMYPEIRGGEPFHFLFLSLSVFLSNDLFKNQN
ncbi:unnamed protein product [Soboliphyme baturini]|uniref:Zinc finger CCCH domain-containing protein 14 n=1 Tax=Soboliphyme baturini TaxID=241478 RepID=A0A183IRC3_9BILA|nr:unnamed protein product [Soboliphyme baturini]